MTQQKSRRSAPKFDDKQLFETAFLAADYARCHAVLEERPRDADTILDEAEVLVRERNYPEIIRSLSALKPPAGEKTLHRDVLLGAAYGYTKEYASASKRLARVIEATPTRAPLHLSARYYAALVAWMDGTGGDAEALLQPVLERGEPNLRARAHVLESWIHARRRDLRLQVSSLEAALAAIDEAPRPDQGVRANALFTLALLSREIWLPEQTKKVRAACSDFPWTSALQVQRFQISRIFGWIDALDGNELQAFRYLRAAQEFAPSPFWQVLCMLDRAYLARSTGELAFSDDQLREADRQAQKLHWGDTNDEERSALLLLAELFADVEPATAQRYLAQFRSLSASVLPALSYGTDPRVRAFAQYSAGVALSKIDEREEAETALREAWQIFEDFEYGWRSALAALALFDLTADERWLTRAEQRIKPWPYSWIAKRIARHAAAVDVGPELSGAQREVLALLLQGKKNAEIAKQLKRSPHTVRNHLAQIFQKLRVKSRSELFAKLRK